MESYEPYPSLLLALATGMLVGLEREHSRPDSPTGRGFVGGIRTYPLISLIGAVSTLLTRSLGPWPLVAAALVVGALLALTYLRDATSGHLGVTTEASALLCFLLGALSLSSGIIEPVNRRMFVVSSIAVTATMLLSSKTQLREFSTKISRDDVIATLKFLVVAVVVLPVLPDEPLGPYGVLNPYRIGLVVMLISAIGFAGYGAIRLFGGGRGLLLTAAVGGLVSSTAVTLSSAQRAKEAPALSRLAGLAVIIASTIMLVRVLAAVFFVEQRVFVALLAPLGAMTLVSVTFCLVFYFRQPKSARSEGAVELSNPFELTSSVKFAGLIVVILLISRWASDTFGSSGSYIAAALAGLADVDAITISMANLVKTGQIDASVAARAIVIALSSNTIVKGILATVLGGRAMGWRVLVTFAATLVTGLVATLVR